MHSLARPPEPYASPTTVAVVMCAIGGAVASIPLGAGFPLAEALLKDKPWGVPVIAFLTAAWTAIVVFAALKTVWPMLFVLAPMGGALVAVAAAMAVLFPPFRAEGDPGASLAALLVMIGLYAGLVGAAFGFLFALFYVIPVAMAARQVRRASADGEARTGIVCAVWLGVLSAVAIPFDPAVDTMRLGVSAGVMALVVSAVVLVLSIAKLRAPRADHAPST